MLFFASMPETRSISGHRFFPGVVTSDGNTSPPGSAGTGSVVDGGAVVVTLYTFAYTVSPADWLEDKFVMFVYYLRSWLSVGTHDVATEYILCPWVSLGPVYLSSRVLSLKKNNVGNGEQKMKCLDVFYKTKYSWRFFSSYS